MKKILILGAGEMQVPIIMKAKNLNLYSIVADYNEKAPGFLYADKKLFVSTLNYNDLLKFASEENIDGLLTTSDYPVNVVAKISRELGLSAMSEKVASICTNKYLQRNLFKKNNINIPFFQLYSEFDDLIGLVDFPYIVKPIDSSASRGVCIVENAEQLNNAFVQAVFYSKERKVLVESFIEGREFSVETYTQGGLTTIIAITEKLLIGEEYGVFVEDTHIQPARLSEIEYNLIREEVLKAIRIIGLDNCPSHTEVKLNSHGVYIIEIACRLGGDYIASDLVPLSTGVDMLENLIKISLGEKIAVDHKWNKVSCVQFVNTENYQRCLEFIHSQNNALIRHEIKPYSDVRIMNSLDRLGFLILRTDTMSQMESILKLIK